MNSELILRVEETDNVNYSKIYSLDIHSNKIMDSLDEPMPDPGIDITESMNLFPLVNVDVDTREDKDSLGIEGSFVTQNIDSDPYPGLVNDSFDSEPCNRNIASLDEPIQ